ncbi:hydrophobin-315 [Armillaria mellea]|nr:hydrophobin-315 [Armillaria mellea]
MFSRALAATVVMIATLTTSVMAAPGTAASCESGPVQCCNSMETAKTLSSGTLGELGILAALVQAFTGPIGVTCSPLSVLALLPNGAQCTEQTVCCDNNNFNGVVALGCTPINVGL